MWKNDLLFLVLIGAHRLTLVYSTNPYFLADSGDTIGSSDGGQSCEQACEARGKTCNLDLLKHAASKQLPGGSEVAICACILESLGKSFSYDSHGHVVGGRYGDDHSGCTFDADSNAPQVLRKNNEDPTCGQVNTHPRRQRVCSCAEAGTQSTCSAPSPAPATITVADILAQVSGNTASQNGAAPATAAPGDDSSADVIWIIVGVCGAVGICTIAACLGFVLSRRKPQPAKITMGQPAAVTHGASPPPQMGDQEAAKQKDMEEAKKAEEKKTDIVAPEDCQVMVSFNDKTSRDQAKELTQFLITNGVPTFSTCVYCPATPGSDWQMTTNLGVATAKVLVTLITKGWLASKECKTETVSFQKRANDANKKMIIPVIFPCITQEDRDDPKTLLFNMVTVQQIDAANPKWMEDVLQGVRKVIT